MLTVGTAGEGKKLFVLLLQTSSNISVTTHSLPISSKNTYKSLQWKMIEIMSHCDSMKLSIVIPLIVSICLWLLLPVRCHHMKVSCLQCHHHNDVSVIIIIVVCAGSFVRLFVCLINFVTKKLLILSCFFIWQISWQLGAHQRSIWYCCLIFPDKN